MMSHEVNGTYGGSKTPATILVYPQRDGSVWYCVEGSRNANRTFDEVGEGVDVETLTDHETMHTETPCETIEDLEREVDES